MNESKSPEWFEEHGFTRITPELASEWLTHNTNNRHIREKFVKSLMDKIENGQWQPFTLDAIGFYEDGTLANGQHRLTAISRGSTPVYAKVEFDLPRDACIAIDAGKSRSAADNIRILTGKDFYTSRISNMINLSSAKFNKSLAPEQHYKIAQMYEDDIVFIKSLFDGSPRYIQSAGIMAATFIALENGVDRNKLSEFVSLLNKAIPANEYEATVVAFRNKVMQEYLQKTSKARHDYNWEIKRCQNVIYHFVNNHQVTSFVSPSNYRYNLIDFNA